MQRVRCQGTPHAHRADTAATALSRRPGPAAIGVSHCFFPSAVRTRWRLTAFYAVPRTPPVSLTTLRIQCLRASIPILHRSRQSALEPSCGKVRRAASSVPVCQPILRTELSPLLHISTFSIGPVWKSVLWLLVARLRRIQGTVQLALSAGKSRLGVQLPFSFLQFRFAAVEHSLVRPTALPGVGLFSVIQRLVAIMAL